MGFIEKAKNIIQRLKKAGKSQKELPEIIKRAAEKATVTKEPENLKRVEGEMTTVCESLQNALLQAGISADEAIQAFEKLQGLKKREKTNNWRKMHGIPMKRYIRRGKRGKRRKKTNCN